MNEFPIEHFSHIMNIHNYVVQKDKLEGSRRYGWSLYKDELTNITAEVFRSKDHSIFLTFELIANDFIFAIDSTVPNFPYIIDDTKVIWNHKKIIISNLDYFSRLSNVVQYIPYRSPIRQPAEYRDVSTITAEYYGDIESILESSAYVSLIS